MIPCDCSFCNQFCFARLNKYKHKYNKEKMNTIKNEDKSSQNNNLPNDVNITLNDVNITLNDLDKITFLNSLEYEPNEISKQTNISHSIIDYILNIMIGK